MLKQLLTEDKPILTLTWISSISPPTNTPPTYIWVESDDKNIHYECNTTNVTLIDSEENSNTPNTGDDSKDWNLISNVRKNDIVKALID